MSWRHAYRALFTCFTGAFGYGIFYFGQRDALGLVVCCGGAFIASGVLLWQAAQYDE